MDCLVDGEFRLCRGRQRRPIAEECAYSFVTPEGIKTVGYKQTMVGNRRRRFRRDRFK